MRKLNFLTSLLMIILFIRCSSTFKVKQVDVANNHKYPTEKTLTSKEILVRENLPQLNEYKQFLYIKNEDEFDKYKNYLKGTLQNIGFFDAIYYKQDLERIVIQKGLTDKVSSISDNIGLLNLQKEIGKFLVLHTSVIYKGGYSYEFNFELIDPTKANTIYKVRNQAFNWSGLDRPLFHPVFNDYAMWIKENQE